MVGQIRAVGDCIRVGGLSKTLKRGGTEKRGGETKILKRGQAGSRGGCLKKGRAGTPLRTMVSSKAIFSYGTSISVMYGFWQFPHKQFLYSPNSARSDCTEGSG